jgi:hypothetical protein
MGLMMRNENQVFSFFLFFLSNGVYVGVTEKREGLTSDEKTRGLMYTWRMMRWCVVLLILVAWGSCLSQ